MFEHDLSVRVVLGFVREITASVGITVPCGASVKVQLRNNSGK